jgi:hypothetical protein
MAKMVDKRMGMGITSSTDRMRGDERYRVHLVRRRRVRITRKGIIGRGRGRRRVVLRPLAHRDRRMARMGLRLEAGSSSKDRGRNAKAAAEEGVGMGRKSMALGVLLRCLPLL